ncbi:DENN/MADD domain containing 2Db [Hypomesus transpacificus]|uniref:DENN/MADD domain containing 2Db n=1 Tax=Hypomesus transpacificus TaxID=137520 RepID=UPI001F080C84|nr:DENN/MADD domain containing 2Db [Hypomesus transpacificus]
MSDEVDTRDHGPMKRLSSIFTSLHDKINQGRRDGGAPVSRAPALSSPQLPGLPSGQAFFEYLVVVSLQRKEGVYQPHITYQFPKLAELGRSQREQEEGTLKAIPLFCFPEGVNWAPLTEYHSETFSFVLTEVDGSRRNGYCRRLLPGGRGARPPEAYCIISRVACFGLFSKIFDEVEKRRQISVAMIYPFMQSLREAPFPAPGDTVNITSFIPESGTQIIRLTRPCDSWLEHVDFRVLFGLLTDEEVLTVFAATVLERRVVFTADELSTLSQVLHAVAALLYPFSWQHTFISIVPTVLIDVVMAPTPYLLGVQKNLLDNIHDHSDMLIVDLSAGAESRFITSMGDEDSLLPVKLQEELLHALSSKTTASTPEVLNRVVSEAFLSFFVKTVGHFSSHMKRSANGQSRVFQKKSFYNATESKTYRQFVKDFCRTQMFDIFIQEEEGQPSTHEGFFQQKVAKYQERKKKEKAKSGWLRGFMV